MFLTTQISFGTFAFFQKNKDVNVAVRAVCLEIDLKSAFRPSFRIVLADVCGPECRKTSLCAVFAKIAFSPAPNAKSNTTNRPLSNDT